MMATALLARNPGPVTIASGSSRLATITSKRRMLFPSKAGELRLSCFGAPQTFIEIDSREVMRPKLQDISETEMALFDSSSDTTTLCSSTQHQSESEEVSSYSMRSSTDVDLIFQLKRQLCDLSVRLQHLEAETQYLERELQEVQFQTSASVQTVFELEQAHRSVREFHFNSLDLDVQSHWQIPDFGAMAADNFIKFEQTKQIVLEGIETLERLANMERCRIERLVCPSEGFGLGKWVEARRKRNVDAGRILQRGFAKMRELIRSGGWQ